jgi:ribosomal protein S18 acetylase RimI-like enzyme
MSLEIIESDLSELEHREAFISLLNEYIRDKMGGGETIEGERRERLLTDMIMHNSRLILLARKDSVYAGLVVCFMGYSTFQITPLMNIHDIIVLSRFRGLGIGRKMMEIVEEKAIKMGCSKMTLEVRYDNESGRHLYMTSGYGECQPPMSFWVKTLQPQGAYV